MIFTVKRGNTFRLSVVVTNLNGDPVDLSTIDIASHLRGTELVEELEIVRVDDTKGEFEMLAKAAATLEWTPNTRPQFDIRFAEGEAVFNCDPHSVDIVETMTHDTPDQ